ncbi:peptidase M3 [Ktedonosporobacter rubrisoli]|uniref:Peptidase M3 n=1 Tax=Ktedonosporobacter rubrisoli TaxID=2509675 RepID=A0A4P6JYW8_KTERU|nr:M3 family oligoendopeptidase [Ktedonosporobacter rubrisoli]QBD81038.1 peptidase M3 [Ktedonosporobacter rubrisoli]
MYSILPSTSEALALLAWSDIEPWYRELIDADLTQSTLDAWLAQWSRLSELVEEVLIKQEIACTRDTADQARADRKQRFLDEIYVHIQPLDQQVKQKLLASNLEPPGFAPPLRKLRTEAELFREQNVPLLNEEEGLKIAYQRFSGSQTVTWEGREVSISKLEPLLMEPERERRERAWHTMQERRLADRETLYAHWQKEMQVRQQIASNAGYATYRDYRWLQLFRFDYTPQDCRNFHRAIEEVLVPAASRVWARRRQLLGVETIRPWDIAVNPHSTMRPRYIADLNATLQQCANLFTLVDPELGAYFEIMIREGLLDLEERPAKAGRGYNLTMEAIHRPFIFGKMQTIQEIRLILHEAGHAFHSFEMARLPYVQQRKEAFLPMEFAEVASTAMEYIGSTYLQQAGICSQEEASLLRLAHLESGLIENLPRAAMVDAFQHWVYEHLEEAQDPQQCTQQWRELTQRYMPDIDWRGLEEEQGLGWLYLRHIHCYPFYYIEYAFARIGALQIWNNYRQDPRQALQQYRHALSLGVTRTLPELYAAAGASFSFDSATLQSVVELVTRAIEELEAQ